MEFYKTWKEVHINIRESLCVVTSEGYHACKDSGRLGHKIQ